MLFRYDCLSIILHLLYCTVSMCLPLSEKTSSRPHACLDNRLLLFSPSSFVKPNTKTSTTSLSSSPSPPRHTTDTEEEEDLHRSPSPPVHRAPTPSPPRVPTPPPAPRIPTPPPPRSPTPPPPPVVAKKEVVVVEEEVEAVAPPPVSAKGTHSRGRGRGKKAAAAQPVIPPARTVITETLGTIVVSCGVLCSCRISFFFLVTWSHISVYSQIHPKLIQL